MPMTDPIADMLTRVRNANNIKLKEVEIPASNIKMEIARILKEEGFIKDFELIKNDKQGTLKIQLKYEASKKRVISVLKRMSKPGRRVYIQKDGIGSVLNGLGIAILSTSKGILTDKKAKEIGVGGELICTVY